MKFYIFFSAAIALAAAQQQYTTPVPILKQINKHNEDGSYSYGYEGADGTYKIESKYPNGEVYGKYGYVDDQGKLREIEYGASRRGFEPAGNEVNVPPPTLNNNNDPVRALGQNEEDDGQYREDPSVYYKDDRYNNVAPVRDQQQPNYISRFAQPQQPAYQPQTYQQAAPQPAYQQPAYQQPAFRPQSKFNFDNFLASQPQPQAYNVPFTQPQPAYSNNYNRYNPTGAATNVDLYSGSYSVNYRRR